MLSFLLFVIAVLVVGGLLFLGGSLLLGRGETQPPADLDRSPVELPDDRLVAGDDVRALQISVAFRGYRMTEVDWLLDQFAQAFDERDEMIDALRRRLAERTEAAKVPTAVEAKAEESGVGESGVGESGVGESGVGESGVGESGVEESRVEDEHGDDGARSDA